MYGVHGIRTGDKARLNMVYEWFLATTRERDTGIIRIPDNKVADKFYGLKQSLADARHGSRERIYRARGRQGELKNLPWYPKTNAGVG